jgi:hypothetical protein
MDTNAERRNSERHCYAADIAFGHFNKDHSYEAETLNLGTGGMCFKSELCLQPGATIYIRLTKLHPNNSEADVCEGLHLVTLAEVKWCKEFFKHTQPLYEIGAKYYGPEY